MGSWSGSVVGSSEPGGVSEGVSAAQVPPEVWQRLLWAYQGWLRRHEGLARVLLRLTRVCQRITFVLMVAALAVVPGLLAALVPAAAMLGCLMVMALLGRTRTVSWRAMSLMFSVGVPWAVVVALLTRVVAGWAGVEVSDDGAGIALAAFIEEPGKLAPLVVAAMVAPGRVRRFAAVDWVLLGFALGAGFTVAEDGARRLIPPGPLAQAMGENLLSYSLNPWTSGEFTMSSGGWTTQILDHTDASGPMIPGHQVWTMTLAAAIALGIALWRTRWVAARLVAWAPVPAVLTLAVSDHAAYNASARSWASAAWAGQGHDGFPEWMLDLWQALGQGRSAIPVSACLLVLCLLVDARRRLRAGGPGITGPEVPRPPALGALGGPSLVSAPLEAVTALAVFSFSDLLVIARAYGQRDLSRGERMVQGHTTAAWVLGVRRQAMSATTPGLEPGARWGFAVGALAMSSLVALGCLWQGITMARAIGPELFYGDDASTPSYFAGLLDALAAFWDELGPAGQILMIATAVMLLMTAGWGLALALAVTGAASWTMTHGHGLASFIRNPGAATSSYLVNVTAGQLAWDLFDFALTFIPGSVFGAGGRTVARTTAREMAESTAAWRAMNDEVAALFRLREERRAAFYAAEEDLKRLMPKNHSMKNYLADEYRGTIKKLEDGGYDPELTENLYDAARRRHEAFNNWYGSSTRIGELGGETYLRRLGYEIPDEFLSENVPVNNGTAPRGWVDGMALSPNGDEMVVCEYKGVSAELSRQPVATQFEGQSLQGSPAYTRNHMLTDPRFANYFHNNPAIWENIKSGHTRLTIKVLYTKAPGVTLTAEQPFTLTPQVIDSLQQAINAL